MFGAIEYNFSLILGIVVAAQAVGLFGVVNNFIDMPVSEAEERRSEKRGGRIQPKKLRIQTFQDCSI